MVIANEEVEEEADGKKKPQFFSWAALHSAREDT